MRERSMHCQRARAWLVCLALLTGPVLTPSPVAAQTIDWGRELLIVHPSVVDPFVNGGRSDNAERGPWSFRFLIENLAPGPGSANAYLRALFEPLLAPYTLPSGEVLPARGALVELILSQFSSVNASGQRVFELWKAPFELIAIAPRLDLRAADGSHAGELRFAFKVTHPFQQDIPFTIIFEYALQIGGIWTLQEYARQVHDLGQLEVGSPEYLDALRNVISRSTNRIYGAPQLLHIRINEKALDTSNPQVWQMREYRHDTSGFPLPVVLENTPRRSHNQTALLARFIDQAPLLAATDTSFLAFQMPAIFQDPVEGALPFLGGMVEAGQFQWTSVDGSGGPVTQADSVAVDNFGLLTCNGCHNDNKLASDIDFYHVSPQVPAGMDGSARLSKFLTEGDPSKGTRRPADSARRADDLRTLLNTP